MQISFKDAKLTEPIWVKVFLLRKFKVLCARGINCVLFTRLNS